MKKHIFTIVLLVISCIILNGCMTTGPIVNDLNHYQKGDTYESIRERNEQESTITNENIEEEVVVEENLENEINDTENTGVEETFEENIEDTEEIE